MKFLFTPLIMILSLIAEAAAPTIASSNLSLNAIDGGFVNLGWTAGNGARRIIVCKAGSAPAFVPVNGADYAESTTFGLGQEVAPGEFIVYDHFSTSFFLVGLSPATQYFIRIYEYNGTGASTEYLTASFLSGSFTTSATPTVQTSNATFSNISTNSITVNWTNGNGTRRLIVMRQGVPVNADPVSGQQYNVNSQFGNGATTAPGNYTVYASTGSSTTISNLQQGTQYFLAFYEFNGNSQPQYLIPAYTTNVTTRSVPTIASTDLSITKTDGQELSLNWTNGNGQRRIIIGRQGADVTSQPVNGIDYNGNAVFGAGSQLNAGEFVVYDDNFHAATISGLNPATSYFFKIFEYDGTGSNTSYLVSSFASVNGSTAITPTIQSQVLPASNITPGSVKINLTAGNGRARLIIGRKDFPVIASPVNLTAYTAQAGFGAGQDLGSGQFVLYNGVDASASITNLQPNSTYHFAIYEFNGFNQPLYLSPAATTSITTSGTLPVSLASWEATPVSGKVKLQWTTSTEENTDRFIVERSAYGSIFQPVASVKAAGNSASEISYETEDVHPLSGRSFYRLKTVDLDGSFSYAAIRVVIISDKQTTRILGNPVNDVLQLVTTIENNKAVWTIVNAAGQVVSNGRIASGRQKIDTSSLAAGQYWLWVRSENRTETLSFLKK